MDPSLMMLAMMIPIFYFFFIRPQTQRQKKQKKFQEELEKGQKVVTNGGIHGRILQVNENTGTVVLEIGNSKMTIEQSSISLDLTAALESSKKNA